MATESDPKVMNFFTDPKRIALPSAAEEDILTAEFLKFFTDNLLIYGKEGSFLTWLIKEYCGAPQTLWNTSFIYANAINYSLPLTVTHLVHPNEKFSIFFIRFKVASLAHFSYQGIFHFSPSQ